MYKFFSLKRVTNSGTFSPLIDGLRFLAIMPVIITHCYYVYNHNIASIIMNDWSIIDGLFKNGGVGVHIFFVISGYVLGNIFYQASLTNSNINYSDYLKRRLIRLEPPYILSLLIFLLVLVFYLGRDINDLFLNFLASIFYVHNIIYGTGSAINTVAWSLEVEFQFYILAPLLYYVYRTEAFVNILFYALILFFVLTCYFMGEFYRSLLSQGHFFILGAMLHVNKSYFSNFLKHNLISLLIFSCSLYCLFLLPVINNSIELNILKLVLLYLIFAVSFCNNLVRQFLSISWIYLIGGICYSIYLIHYPLLSFLSTFNIFTSLPFSSFLIISVLIVILVSSIFAIFVERPFMNFHFFKSKFFSHNE